MSIDWSDPGERARWFAQLAERLNSAQLHLLQHNLGSAKEALGHMSAARLVVEEVERELQAESDAASEER